MDEKDSILYSLSKNKYNINLLETIEHKDLFKNINKNFNRKIYKENSNQINNKNLQNYDDIENDYYIINDENQNNKENNIKKENFDEAIYLNNEPSKYKKNNDSAPKILNHAKMSSKSFKDIVKQKLNNFQELFTKLSPEKNKRCVTQDNNFLNKETNNIKTKNELKLYNNENIENNDINIKYCNFKSNNKNNNSNMNEQKDNIYYYSNDFKRNNQNISYFKKGKKNESKNSIYSYSKQFENSNLDVYNRLYNKAYYNKKKNNGINNNEENNCTFNPQLLSNIKSKKNNECLANFIQRQERFNKYIKQKKINLKKDINNQESKKYTFTPNTSCTSGSKYSIKLEAERQEESNLDKANRMVYDSMKKIEDKNNILFNMYNTQYSFIPSINKNFNYKKNMNNNKINYSPKKRNKSFEKNKKNEENIKKVKHKYVNHEYDNIKSNYKNDKELMKRIKEENKKRVKKINIIRKEQENEDSQGCTFKPDINKKNHLYYFNFINNDNNMQNYYKEMTYVGFYNKKKSFKNRLNRSQSYSRNNWYVKSNINYNNYNSHNYSNLRNDCLYNTDFKNDNFNKYNCYGFNNDNNVNINYTNYCNNCNNNIDNNNELDNNEGYNFNYNNNYNDEYEEFQDSEELRRGRKIFNDNYYNQNNYLNNNISPKTNKLYYKDDKCKMIKEIKKEDKQNFLLIHKLLYNP